MTDAIAVFDVGKTNKKLFLFDEQYRIVWDRSIRLSPATDEDGDACEDLQQLTQWVRESVDLLARLPDIRVRAVNYSAYGASLVHIGMDGKPVTPLYDYLKSYPEALKNRLYGAYGGEVTLSMLTASPVLGSLNSGMQIYRIKEERPELFDRIKYSLHLPQYLSYLLTGEAVSDITSIGCHTNLWNFPQQHYHEWVYREGLIGKLAPIVPSSSVRRVGEWLAGVGLHDSSAATIPYLESYPEPFLLISTGTWCITMNPFNDAPLTVAELQQDCLCYMSYLGRPVKASRLFAGHDHEQQVGRLAGHFQRSPEAAATVAYDAETVERLRDRRAEAGERSISPVMASAFGKRDLAAFDSFEQAYHCLLMDIMDQQAMSTRLVLRDTEVRRIFVDGGFGKNQLYMHLLARAFPDMEVFAASIPQATAMGAAMAIHSHWNKQVLPGDVIELKYFR